MKAVLNYLHYIQIPLACLLFLVLGSIALMLLFDTVQLALPLTVTFVGVGHFCLWMIMDMLVPVVINAVRDAWRGGGLTAPFRVWDAFMGDTGLKISLIVAFCALFGLALLFGLTIENASSADGFPYRYLFVILLLMVGILLTHGGLHVLRYKAAKQSVENEQP